MKNFWNFDIFYPKIFNFSSKISLKFSSFLEGWNIDQRLTRCWAFISCARTPSICTHKAHLTQNIFLPKMLKYDQIRKLGVCAFWVHILDVRARDAKLPYHTSNIFRSHIKRTITTKVIKNQKSVIISQFFTFFFTHFLLPVFWHFHRFLEKKIWIFFWSQNDPILLLNPWNRFI